MRELSISFFLLFLLFVCLDVSTTSYSLGIRNALFDEIDNRIALGAAEIKREIHETEKLDLDLKKTYPILAEYSLGWVELFDSNKNLVVSSDYKVRFIPEEFPDTLSFWGYRYGLFPVKDGYLLVTSSDEQLSVLKRVFRVSLFLKILVYFSFIALGFYIFWVFSYPFKKVREVTGEKGQNIDYTMRTIREMVKDYRGKLKNVQERERELKQRLFLSNLGENVTQVLHEIRNATGAIFGFGKLVENEEIKRGILEETSRLNDFSMNLLSLSGPLKLEVGDVNLKDLIALVIKRLENEKVDIKTHIGDDIGLKVDGELLGRAIYNILDNALDACKEKGQIIVSVEKKKKNINILIEDTGVGMDKRTLSSIFDLFFSKKDGGVGVGMAVAKRIIESHNGDIRVKSKPGKGSKFLITLPQE
ncbi:GHKL domain-containing protein [candidate division WOR-3 bacterium]|nr:GHKL domain-containing protein [candidate division WOR-3 bacterium]